MLSLLFLLASVTSLLMGLRRGGLTLVFVSIGFSLLAALFLAASVLRKRSDREVEEEETGKRVDEWRAAPRTGRSGVTERPYSSHDPVDSLGREPLVGVIDRPVAGGRGPELDIPLGPAPGDSDTRARGRDVMVAVSGDIYHLPGCERAGSELSADRMERVVAKRLGFMACEVCRPR